MRISIWQQFSSNHSSFFTIVGEFKTDEDANAAYQTWYELITSVTDWWKQRDQSPYWNWEHGPSDPETDFSKKHDITWQENPIDWFGQPNELQKVLQKVRNRVLVNVEFETWQSPELAEKIMSSLGGKTIKQTSEDITLLVNFSCYGPDEKKAQEVYTDWVSRIKVDERWGNDLLPPWETIFSLDITKTQIMGKALYFQVAFFHLRELAEMVNYFERLGFTNRIYI